MSFGKTFPICLMGNILRKGEAPCPISYVRWNVISMRAETVLKQVRVWFVPSNFVEQPNFDRCFPGRFDMKRVSRDFTRVCKHVFKRIVLVKLSKSFKGFKVRERPTSVRFNSVFIRLVDKTFSVAWIIEPAWKRNYKLLNNVCFLSSGAGLTLLAAWFLEVLQLCSFGYRFCSSCCWSSIAWLPAA